MKLTFQLTNKDFEDSLMILVNGETRELTEEKNKATFEVEEQDGVDIRISYVRNDMPRLKHPIGKVLMWVLVILLSPIAFLMDNDGGIRIHKFFFGAKPFDVKKTYCLKKTGEVVGVTFLSPKYNQNTKRFTSPDIAVHGAEIEKEELSCNYNQQAMKTAFWVYHYPCYIFFFATLLALLALMVVCVINQFEPFDLQGIIALSFCAFLILMLFVVFVCLFIRTHRLFRQVDYNLCTKEPEKDFFIE